MECLAGLNLGYYTRAGGEIQTLFNWLFWLIIGIISENTGFFIK